MSEVGRNPYIGPRPFERVDLPLFFGRDREIRELLSLVVAHRVVLLYASSGAGKTSLLNAGLLPLLEEEEGFQTLPPARVSGGETPPSGANPFAYNVIANWTLDLGTTNVAPQISLAQFLRGRERPVDPDGLAAPRLAVLDQFEEIFTRHQQHWELREPFFQQVAEALDDDPLLRVVLAIREDYLAQLDRYAPLLPEGLRTRLRLERLSGEAALTAVTQPVATTCRRYAPGVAERLVGDLLTMRVDTGAGGVVDVAGEYAEPVQLQVACRSLWEALPPDVVEITADHLATFGDVDEVLGAFYTEAVAAAAKAGRVREGDLRVALERTFITAGGTRGTVYAAADGADGIPSASIDELERRHLVLAEFRAGARWLELTHDRLIEPIRISNRTFSAAWQTVPASTAAFIAGFIRFSRKQYVGETGRSVIGYSHEVTHAEVQSGVLVIGGESVPLSGGVTKEQALKMLQQDLVPVQTAIERAVKVELTANQLGALTSFVYNVGFGPLKGSLRTKLNAGKYDQVPAELRRWVRVAGSGTHSGLVGRRAAEVALWNTK